MLINQEIWPSLSQWNSYERMVARYHPLNHRCMLTYETRYKILKLIEANPQMSKREVTTELGISLGKANYFLKALIEKGILEAFIFRNSQNKLAYLFRLTPKEIEEKASINYLFLKIKMNEYEQLQLEIVKSQNEFSQQRKISGTRKGLMGQGNNE